MPWIFFFFNLKQKSAVQAR